MQAGDGVAGQGRAQRERIEVAADELLAAEGCGGNGSPEACPLDLGGLSTGGPRIGGLLGECDHLVGMGDHRDVAARDFNRARTHALGEVTLGLGRDGLIVGRHHVPRRQRLPRRDTHHVSES